MKTSSAKLPFDTSCPLKSALSMEWRWAIMGCLILGWVGTVGMGQEILLRDVSESTGISFRHDNGYTGKYYIMEGVASGLALFDYNNDGYIDIYFLSGAYPKGTTPNTVPQNMLYRNNGDWTFTDVTQEAGVGHTGFGLGVAAGDYDNDGDLDLYVNNHGPNVLYRNNGNGTFTDVAQKAGVAHGKKMGAGANFLDMDKDGDLDLFVSSYVDYSIDRHKPITTSGFPVYPGPSVYDFTYEALYRNNGDGTFTDVSKESGIAGELTPGMGSVCVDYDNDGDTDIAVANDTRANSLFQNDGTGKFEEVGLIAGIAYDLHGETQGSMGIDFGDYDNDGWLDLYLTSYESELTSILRNLGDDMGFEDVTLATGAGMGTFPLVTWGEAFIDLDNDGDRDLFVACGHIQDKVEEYDDRATYLTPNILFMNTGSGRFVDVSKQSGDGMQVKLSSRGLGFDDLDNDGDADAVILNSRACPNILRNDTAKQGHWLQVELKGVTTNRDGIGAHVKVYAGNLTLLDEVHSGRSYQSHFGMRLYFGLGHCETVDRIEVTWIGGGKDVFHNIKVDQRLLLTEGMSTPTVLQSQNKEADQ